MSDTRLIERIDALLPQTQCTQCGYQGCRPYAEAIAEGAAEINRCPPGGTAGVAALAELLARPALPLDESCGEFNGFHLAEIEEKHCIGCTLCIAACPVDAIIGANKRMHTVLTDWCTGCELCLPACPVDCIRMVPAGREWQSRDATLARQRHQAHLARRQRPAPAPVVPAPPVSAAAQAPAPAAQKQALIADVLARARARRQAGSQ